MKPVIVKFLDTIATFYILVKHVTAALFQVTLKCIHSADMFTC